MTAVDEALDLDLAHAEVVLLGLGALSRDRLGSLDPAVRLQLDSGLRTALRAVNAAQLSAGRPPLPGGDFLLPRDVRLGARS